LNEKLFKRAVMLGVLFINLIVVVGLFQINTAIIPMSTSDEPEKIGKNDFTADLGIWENTAEAIKSKIDADKLENPSVDNSYILTHNWFPGAHLDYYYALPNDVKLYVLGSHKKQHEYLRINKMRGAIPLHSNVYYITTSNYFSAPEQALMDNFESVESPEIIPVKIKDKTIINLFIWRLKDLKTPIDFLPI
jgi:hypothetical protein